MLPPAVVNNSGLGDCNGLGLPVDWGRQELIQNFHGEISWKTSNWETDNRDIINMDVTRFPVLKLQYEFTQSVCRSRDRVVSTVTGYELDDRGVGVRVLVGSSIFSSPRRPDQLRGPPSHLSNGYRELLPRR
jgi:hypothetical protein